MMCIVGALGFSLQCFITLGQAFTKRTLTLERARAFNFDIWLFVGS